MIKRIALLVAAVPVIAAGGYKEDFAAAQKLFLSGKYKDAVAAYEKAEKSATNTSQAAQSAVRKARSLVALGKKDEAEKFINEKFSDPKFGDGQTKAEAYYDLGLRYENAGQLDKAAEYYAKGGDTTTATFAVANCLSRQGIILKNKRKYAEAKEVFQKILSGKFRNGEKCTTFCQMAVLAAMGKDFGKANFIIEEAERVLPNNIEVKRAKVEVLIFEGKFADALKLNTEIAENPKTHKGIAAAAFSRNAWIYYYRLKQNDKALAELEKASKLNAPWGFDKALYKRLKK